MKRLRESLLIGGIVLLMPLIPVLFYGFFVSFPVIRALATGHARMGETQCAGQVVRLVRHGVLWKSWEGTLAVTQAGSPAGPTQWVSYGVSVPFSIGRDDPRAEEKARVLLGALRSGAHLRLRISERVGRLPWRGDTGDYLEEAELSPLPGGGGR